MELLIEFVKSHKNWHWQLLDGRLRIYYQDDTWYILYRGNRNGFYVFEATFVLNPEWHRNVAFTFPFSDDPELISISLFGELKRWLDRKFK